MPKITLATPFKRASDGVVVSEISLRRPTVKDARRANAAAGSDDFARSVHLIAAIADLSPADVEAMDLADFNEVLAQTESFAKPRTSES